MSDDFPYKSADDLNKRISESVSALEMPGTGEFAKQIGVIIGWFALIEPLLPKALAHVGTMRPEVAERMMTHLRAPSLRIGLLEAAIKGVPAGIEKEVASYIKGHIKPRQRHSQSVRARKICLFRRVYYSAVPQN
ncbi:hypothetical protein [Brevundimonas sp.]|uniref:hypothetical protein n=1 Tax=Brevundimonas sp. TaxID=1871086 RepID=UPI002737815A|nr:hypothetical protein [Brevundimonas sp.]MDP3800893.1 hypothetical protein [Brevundimonas sp.]